jgi:hypothetical protein
MKCHRLPGPRDEAVNKKAAAAQAALFATLCSVIGLPLLMWPAGRDQGIEGATAAAWIAGAIPYRDVWNHSLPGGFGVAALAQLCFGTSDVGLRAFDLALLSLAGLAIVSWLRVWVWPWLAWWAGSFFVLEYVGRGDFWQTTQRDGFLVAPVLWALWLARRRSSDATAALAGLLIGLAMLCKPGAGAALLALALWRRGSLRQMSWACFGCAAPLAFFAVWLSAHDAWPGFVDSVVHFNDGYARLVATTPLGRLQALAWLIATFLIPMRPELLASVLLLALSPRASTARREVLVLVVVAAACPLLQAGAYPYHLLPLHAPLCIAVGLAVGAVHERLTSSKLPAATAGGITLGLCAALSSLPSSGWLRHVRASNADSSLHRFDTADFRLADLEQVARRVASSSSAAARVQVWGPDAGVLLRAQRASATRYPTYLPLVAPWTQDRERPRFTSQLRAAAPDFFVVQRTASPMLSGRPQTPEVLLASFPELDELLRVHYHATLQNPGFTLLERNR